MRRLSWLLACVILSSGAPGAAATPPGPAAPRLVVVIIVDQLPAGKLEENGPRLTGGLRRFLDAGRRFTRCGHAHAATETGPGHATLLSGLFPAHSGIVANDWYDREAHREINCVEDDGPGAVPSRDGSRAVSASHLKGANLADLMKRANPASKVYTVAGKDRSAILTGGHQADGMFWYSFKTGGFTSSPRLLPVLPSWGSDFWAGDPMSTDLYRENVPAEWTYTQRPDWGPDDQPAESPAFSRVAPHPVTAMDPAHVEPKERVATIARRVFTSPWVDWMTLELAGRILEGARLGDDAAPDLLVVGLSGVDAVGHTYGPKSQEYLDALIRIDGWLERFMKQAARHGTVLFALSADHGVLPLPELVTGARRVDDTGLKARLEKGMAARFAGQGEGPFIEAMVGGDIHLDRRTLDRNRIPLGKAIDAARAELSGWSEIARVYTGAELAAQPSQVALSDSLLELYRNSYDPGRSGDLVIQPCEKCLFTSRPYGTSHGSPYAYDRDVPMILIGDGIEPGEDLDECRTVDLAPTLAERLGLTFDAPRDGRSLLEPPAVDAVDRPAPRK